MTKDERKAVRKLEVCGVNFHQGEGALQASDSCDPCFRLVEQAILKVAAERLRTEAWKADMAGSMMSVENDVVMRAEAKESRRCANLIEKMGDEE